MRQLVLLVVTPGINTNPLFISIDFKFALNSLM